MKKTISGIVVRLESLERVARNRGSLACDRLANQIGDVRVELERVVADMGNPISPPAESQSVCTCPSGDGSLRWPCPAHPPVGDAVLRTAVEYHYAQAAFPCDQFGNTSHHPNPKLQAWHKQVADALSAQQPDSDPNEEDGLSTAYMVGRYGGRKEQLLPVEDGIDALRDLRDVCIAAINAGDWSVDGACDPDAALRRADAVLAHHASVDEESTFPAPLNHQESAA